MTVDQAVMREEFGAICRAVWNTALDQRRQYRRRGAWMNCVYAGSGCRPPRRTACRAVRRRGRHGRATAVRATGLRSVRRDGTRTSGEGGKRGEKAAERGRRSR
ncbi:helix-turn-helix domain-containing protein [Streptomyces sp. cg2]|uniref:helix-turn-helix domain-containing protein n=1 Tax=Streptomyces sp. cg2 TaxID=3238799 RepID=UPI0034E24DA5